MGTIGDCYDNSPMESFWGTMQIELLNRKRWTTKLELTMAIADYRAHTLTCSLKSSKQYGNVVVLR
jgi:transposase InsO family protein